MPTPTVPFKIGDQVVCTGGKRAGETFVIHQINFSQVMGDWRIAAETHHEWRRASNYVLASGTGLVKWERTNAGIRKVI
jgi:hypothetical protein